MILFKTKGSVVSFLKKRVLQENNETYVGHFDSVFFFCFLQMRLSFITFFVFATKPGTTNPKLSPCNQHLVQGMIFSTFLIFSRNYPISIGDMAKDQTGSFLLLKTQKNSSAVAKIDSCLRCQSTVRIFCLVVRPWYLIQNHESRDETVRLGRSENGPFTHYSLHWDK